MVPVCFVYSGECYLAGVAGLLLAWHTARLAKQPASVLKLFMFYLDYGFARAYAMVKPSVRFHAVGHKTA